MLICPDVFEELIAYKEFLIEPSKLSFFPFSTASAKSERIPVIFNRMWMRHVQNPRKHMVAVCLGVRFQLPEILMLVFAL